MNEIDMALWDAKVITWNNKPTNIAVHGFSVEYNIAQIGRYRYLIAERQAAMANGTTCFSYEELNQYQWEFTKHILFVAIDIIRLFCIRCGRRNNG